ncbi:hypothetical protein LTR37_018806 [Vermiconidia calcicola]|uniref:Uncharacterized protein n=1 Tax=Vermiconidia calcicola TaxID=1690605 RepID=A0ACC3MFY1_9PEZI|nr:hypothetical protein LTR37_018806 [Vermiconidia calcicola]
MRQPGGNRNESDAHLTLITANEGNAIAVSPATHQQPRIEEPLQPLESSRLIESESNVSSEGRAQHSRLLDARSNIGTDSRTLGSRSNGQTENADAVAGHLDLEASRLPPPTEWKSIWLTPWVLGPVIVITILLFCSVIGMSIQSARHQGLVTINLSEYHSILRLGDVEVYILTVASIVRAAGSRQPYVELRRSRIGEDKGAPAEKSISLDYQSHWAVVAPWKAITNGHFLLAYSFGIMLVANIVLTALAANLLYTANVQRGASQSVTQSLTFNPVERFQTTDHWDLTAATDRVLGARVYGGELQPWTTLTESILPFATDKVPSTKNFTVPAISWSAELDCRVLDTAYEFELGLTSDGWKFNAVDRGCEFKNQYFSAVATVDQFLGVFSNWACGPQARWHRVLVVAAIATGDRETVQSHVAALTNKTAVSCIPLYSSSIGLLSVSIDASRSDDPVINSFAPTAREVFDPPPIFTRGYEAGLEEVPTTQMPGLFSSQFGELVYRDAKAASPESYFSGDVLRLATERVFASTFAVVAQQYLLEPSTPHQVTGTVYQAETRLVIVLPVAYTIVSILLTLLIMLVWISWYGRTHASILYEEPIGMLGVAALLRKSELMEMVDAVHAGGYGGKVARTIAAVLSKSKSRWEFEDWDLPESARLRSIRSAFRTRLPRKSQ